MDFSAMYEFIEEHKRKADFMLWWLPIKEADFEHANLRFAMELAYDAFMDAYDGYGEYEHPEVTDFINALDEYCESDRLYTTWHKNELEQAKIEELDEDMKYPFSFGTSEDD